MDAKDILVYRVNLNVFHVEIMYQLPLIPW